MTRLERSAALRRLGITEWLPRSDDAVATLALSADAIADDVHAAQATLTSTTTISERSSAQSPRPSPAIEIAATATATKPAPAAPNSTALPVVPVSQTGPASSAAPSLRGRLLSVSAGAPLLVLAMAEKSAQDNLLGVDTAAGALLKAMLNELAVPASVALLGVGGGDPIAVPPTILVLGERSARLLLGSDLAAPIRGRVHLFGQSRVVVSYHPEELRQNGSLKRLAWEDLRLLTSLLAQAQPTAASTTTGRS